MDIVENAAAFRTWVAAENPTTLQLQALLAEASVKHSRSDWPWLLAAINSQMQIDQKEQECKTKIEAAEEFITDLVQHLDVFTFDDFNKLIKWANANFAKLDIHKTRAFKSLLSHPDMASHPPLASVAGVFICRQLAKRLPVPDEWVAAATRASAKILHDSFKRQGIAGYASSIDSLEFFMYPWFRKGAISVLRAIWREMHRLSGSKEEFGQVQLREYAAIHETAERVPEKEASDTDEKQPNPWFLEIERDPTEIINEVTKSQCY